MKTCFKWWNDILYKCIVLQTLEDDSLHLCEPQENWLQTSTKSHQKHQMIQVFLYRSYLNACLLVEQHSSAVPAEPVSAEGGGPAGGRAGLEGDGENQRVPWDLRLRAAALHSWWRSDQSPLYRLVKTVINRKMIRSTIVNSANGVCCLSAAQRTSLWQ